MKSGAAFLIDEFFGYGPPINKEEAELWNTYLNVHENLPSIDEYKNMLENAGFNVVQCIDITDNYTDFTWDRY